MPQQLQGQRFISMGDIINEGIVNRNRLAVLAVTALIGACGGGAGNGGRNGEGGTGGGYCLGSFVNGTATPGSTVTCSGCSIQNPSTAVDDSSSTYATLVFGVNGGQLTLRATAPSGMSFPSGANAGALMEIPTGSFTNVGVRFNTYRNGVLVDSMQGGQMTTVGNVNGAGTNYYYGIQPSATIDSIEAVVSLSGNSDTENVRLFEFCGDH